MILLRALSFAVAALVAAAASAASIPLQSGPLDPGNALGNENALIAAINAGAPGFAGWPGRNYLDNGGMTVAAHGTADTTGATTAGCVLASYTADRWCVDTNVTSGTGHGQVITATPSPPVGFQRSVKIWRNSAALLQPICFMQEIETARAVQLQAKSVIFSAYVQGLAGNTATAALRVALVTGTGTDEGLGALRGGVGMTASPAITPALTGLASTDFAAASASPAWTPGKTASWRRIYSAPLTVPAGATEAVVEICTTPVGSSSGATDGIAITGVQLEVADPGQIVPSSFEFMPAAVEALRTQRFYQQITETNGAVFCNGMVSATNVETVVCPLPVPMQAVPVVAVTAGGFEFNIAGTPTAVGGGFAAGATQALGAVSLVGAVTATAAQATQMLGSNTSGKVTISADF